MQHRGQPSTHDVKLGIETFAAITNRKHNIQVPSYDKSAFTGAGDRLPTSKWEICNREGEPPVEVVIFEGWCVGFRALSDEDVERKWKAAVQEFETWKLPVASFVCHVTAANDVARVGTTTWYKEKYIGMYKHSRT